MYRHNVADPLVVAKRFPNLGCTHAEFIAWFERQLEPGWTWENYGRGKVWNIDHIIPRLALRDGVDWKVICHYTNLRPMSCAENSLRSPHRGA